MRDLIIILISAFPFIISSQHISLHTMSVSEALEYQGTHDLIFLQLTGSKCSRCDEITVEALNNPAVADVYKDVLCIQIGKENPDMDLVRLEYRIDDVPAALIINRDGEYLSHLPGSTINSKVYYDLYHKALGYLDNPPFREYESRYAYGERSKDFLRSYIYQLEAFKLLADDVVEDYARLLTFGDTDNKEEMIYLFERAPLVGSLAKKVLDFNEEVRDDIYEGHKSSGLGARINTHIIRKSRRKAIITKDEDYMMQVARFARNTWSDNWKRGQLSFNSNMKVYYFETNDEENFNKIVKKLYENHYMDLDPDSMRIRELGENPLSLKKNSYGDILNSMAWETYLISEDIESLLLALEMSERSLQFYRDPSLLDTKARLLFKLGEKEEAIRHQEEAIRLLELMGIPEIPKTFTEALEKMKNNTLLDDLNKD